MRGLQNIFGRFDYNLVISLFLILSLGLLAQFSLSINDSPQFISFFRQLFFILASIFAGFVFSMLNWRIFKNSSLIILALYIFTIILLTTVLFLGQEIRGTSGWFKFGSFYFQPVELAKITLILVLAKYFSTRHQEIWDSIHILVSGIYTFILVALTLLQPDVGSALVLVFIWISIMIASGIRFRHILILGLIFILIVILGWNFLFKDYQKDRILVFLGLKQDPLGTGYNVLQSVIAVGSGGVFGKGLGWGTQTQLKFLPEAKTDFIFSAFAEEWGALGVAILFSLFMILLLSLTNLMLLVNENFSRLFIIGFTLLIFFQIIINIAMNLGILPVIGLPLPFMSAGGSHLLFNFVGLGILLNIMIQR